MSTLKVFATRDEAAEFLSKATLVEPYDAFLLMEAPPRIAKQIARRFPVEDITPQFELELPNVTINTNRPRVTTAGVQRHPAYKGDRITSGKHHYIVQFIGPIKERWISQVKAAGAEIVAPRTSFSYLVRANAAALSKISALRVVRWVGHLPYSARVSPTLVRRRKSALPRRRVRPNAYRVEVFASADAGRIAAAARRLGFTVLSSDPQARVLIVESGKSDGARDRQIRSLAAARGVRFIRERVVPRTSNNIATTIMGNSFAATSASGLQLTGAGEIVAVCDTGIDTGDPSAIHPDFAGRVLAVKSYPITADWKTIINNPGGNDGPADFDSGHGTHVAGSILGNGAASAGTAAVVRGHAFKAKLVFQAVEQEMQWKPNAPPSLAKERYVLAGIPNNLKPLFTFAYDQGARVHSNSWGGGDPGAYDDQCRQFDQFVWDHKDFCFVIAAGNDGTDSDGDGSINMGSVTSPGTAKNCITVGACENHRPEFDGELYGDWWPSDFPVKPFNQDPMADQPDEVVPFSSRGPTVDNRVKPDVVAPGTFILSTRSSKIAPSNFAWSAYKLDKAHYFFMGGTSMATPLTSGAVALLREFLRTSQGIAQPSAALLKGLLIAGAQRLPGTASSKVLLDNHQGYGRVNLDRSVKSVLSTVDHAGLKTGEKGTVSLKVPAGQKTLRIVLCYSDFPGRGLINDLNLIVTSPTGKKAVGNQPSGSRSLALDSANNVEVVEVAKAKAGTWTVDVVASNVAKGPQDFAIAAVLV
jgi:subtilisin family serine protease